MLLETPSKSTNISKTLSDDDSGSDDLFEMPTPELNSPFQEKSLISKELENTIYPPTKDEQIVNTALVIFLNALTIPFSLANNWALHRKIFKVEFEEASYEARTDGYLSDLQGNAQVIIEVKPVLRSAKLVAIQIQESAQVVAWVKSDDESSNKGKKVRLHLSQDRDEIYLTVAMYDDKYIDYLENKNQLPCFMTMRQFGPWNILNDNNMRYLGPLLAITLRAQAGDEENKKNKP